MAKIMKNIKLLVLFTLGLQAAMHAAQESKQDYERERQAIIDDAMNHYKGLQDGFAFLQSQGLVDKSFHDFLEKNLSEDEEQDPNFGQVIGKAHDLIDLKMKNVFISTL